MIKLVKVLESATTPKSMNIRGSFRSSRRLSRTRALAFVLSVVAMTFLGGCVQMSLAPWCTPDQIVRDDRIVGVWGEEDEWFRIEYKSGEERVDHNHQLKISYCVDSKVCESLIRTTDKEKYASEAQPVLGELSGFLFELNGELYLNTTVTGDYHDLFDNRGFELFHLPPTYLLQKVTFRDDEVEFATLNYKWFAKHAHQKTLEVNHHFMRKLEAGESDSIVLADSTENLQQLLLEYVGDEELFTDDPLVLPRVHLN